MQWTHAHWFPTNPHASHIGFPVLLYSLDCHISFIYHYRLYAIIRVTTLGSEHKDVFTYSIISQRQMLQIPDWNYLSWRRRPDPVLHIIRDFYTYTCYIEIPDIPHWRRVTQCIYASVTYANIGSNNVLSPVRRQAIIWTNADLLSRQSRISFTKDCGHSLYIYFSYYECLYFQFC